MNNFTLLIVDDIEDNLVALTMRLELSGYDDVSSASNGREAVELMRERKFDLVLLDIMMPEMDGYQVLEEMKIDTELRDIPVIMISAVEDLDSVVRCIELGAVDYLTKPFNLRELLLRVEALLRRHPAPGAGVDMLDFSGNKIDFRTHRARTWKGQEVEPTPTELKLLRLLASREGVVVSRREIVDHLFGTSTPVTTRTLDNLVLRLRKLFERESQHPRHLHTVRGVGLRFTVLEK